MDRNSVTYRKRKTWYDGFITSNYYAKLTIRFNQSTNGKYGRHYGYCYTTYGNARMAGASTPKALLKFHNSINPLVRDGTWSGGFKNLRYVFKDQQEQRTLQIIS